ncbi:YraN family protein [Streptomyces sp. YIM 98790]|uniref:YraN family protein n=1 Tax=Streptomyces sp. YIM 98790 TaxID=2689077 RepID=UPI0014097C16|nr:YraN family protein [Streptomyces sp. YIM 98790]
MASRGTEHTRRGRPARRQAAGPGAGGPEAAAGRRRQERQRSAAALGRYGERLAVRRLGEAGLTVLDRNWRCAEGELDIVAREDAPPGGSRGGPVPGPVVVVCEVKTRRAGGPQHPMAGVTPEKAERLRRLAERWLAERWLPAHGTPPPGGVRIDLIGVLLPDRGPAVVQHARGAA